VLIHKTRAAHGGRRVMSSLKSDEVRIRWIHSFLRGIDGFNGRFTCCTHRVAGWRGGLAHRSGRCALVDRAGTVNFFDNLHWTATTAPVSTAALGWLAWRRALEPGQRDLLFWMALGVTGYALGQVVWDVQVALDYLPFPAPPTRSI
jgi:hypothetical protein